MKFVKTIVFSLVGVSLGAVLLWQKHRSSPIPAPSSTQMPSPRLAPQATDQAPTRAFFKAPTFDNNNRIRNHPRAADTEELKKRREQQLWEQARRSDEEQQTNRPLREREEILMRQFASLQLGMRADQVVAIIGEPNRISAPQSQRINKRGETIIGSVYNNRSDLPASEGDVNFIYTPHPQGRSFNKPDEYFKVFIIGFNRERMVTSLASNIPHPTVFAE